MLKRTVLFVTAVLLCACAGVKQIPPDARGYKQPRYFARGEELAAFKVTAQFSDQYWQGVLRVKKVGPQDYDVLALGDGAYKIMDAVVTPQGIAFRYLYKDADTAAARGRITQFLNLLLLEPGVFKSIKEKKDSVQLTYEGTGAKVRYTYLPGSPWPESAQSVTLLNTAKLSYGEYTPVGEDGGQIPHVLVYQDGGLTLDMTLISLR